MKRFAVILLLAVCCAGYAQNSVTLYLKSGKSVSYTFQEKPVMSYYGNELLVSTQEVQVQYALESIYRLCFEDNSQTTVKEVINADVRFAVGADAITITGEEPESDIYIYDLNGVCVGKYSADENGDAEISIRELSDGIYVVKTSALSFKITKL